MSSPSKHKLSLLAAAVLSASFSSSQAANLVVNSALDDGTDCTLRDAIASVNDGTLAAGCSSSNAAPLGTNDSIVFDAGLDNATIALTSGQLVLDASVSINASSLNSLIIDASSTSRIIQIGLTSEETVSLSNLTLNSSFHGGSGGAILLYGQGDLTVDSLTITDNTAGFGSGIYSSTSGTLTISNSTISDNYAMGGGGTGLHVNGGIGTVVIEDSIISNNTASYDGGGITVSAGTLTISDTTMEYNTAARTGGGILVNGQANLTINNLTITGNTSPFGAGIYSASTGDITIAESQINGNRAYGGGGGGLHFTGNPTSVNVKDSVINNNTASYDGGGITSSVNNLTISDTTISNNSATRSGGGIALSGGLVLTGSTLHSNVARNDSETNGVGGAIGSLNSALNPIITNSTISGNISSDGAGGLHTPGHTSFTIQNSTIKDNISSNTPFANQASLILNNTIVSEIYGMVDCNNYASFSATTGSIIEGSACGTGARTVSADLLPLADNGGPTLTHAIELGSNAINTGDSAGAGCPATDQRGVIRQDECDVGAYEFIGDSGFIVIPLVGKKAVIMPL